MQYSVTSSHCAVHVSINRKRRQRQLATGDYRTLIACSAAHGVLALELLNTGGVVFYWPEVADRAPALETRASI